MDFRLGLLRSAVLAFLLVSLELTGGLTSRAQELRGSPRVDLIGSEVLLQRAFQRFSSLDYRASVELCGEALKANPYLVEAYLLRGMALARLGRLPEAIRQVELYLQVRPRDLYARRLLSRLAGHQERVKSLWKVDVAVPVGWAREVFDPYDLFGGGVGGFLAKLFERSYNFSSLCKNPFDEREIFACDFSGGKVLRFSPRGIEAMGRGILKRPVSAVVDARGNLLVADFDLGRIFAFEREGSSFKRWTTLVDSGLLEAPRDLARHGDGFLAVDQASSTVHMFDRFGREVWRLGPRVGEVTLLEPCAVASDGSTVSVADLSGGRVVSFGAEDRSRVAVLEVPSPVDLAYDDLGRLYVLSLDGRVRVFRGKDLLWELELLLPNPSGVELVGQEIWTVHFDDPRWCRGYSQVPLGEEGFLSLLSVEVGEGGKLSASFTATFGARPFGFDGWDNISMVYGGTVISSAFRISRVDPNRRPVVWFDPSGTVPALVKDRGLSFAVGPSWRDELERLSPRLFTPDSAPILVTPGTASLKREEAESLLAFCRLNAVRIFVVSDEPSSLDRVLAFATGGRVLPSLREENLMDFLEMTERAGPRCWRVEAVLPAGLRVNPDDLGYPTFSLFASFSSLDAEDGLPVFSIR